MHKSMDQMSDDIIKRRSFDENKKFNSKAKYIQKMNQKLKKNIKRMLEDM